VFWNINKFDIDRTSAGKVGTTYCKAAIYIGSRADIRYLYFLRLFLCRKIYGYRKMGHAIPTAQPIPRSGIGAKYEEKLW